MRHTASISYLLTTFNCDVLEMIAVIIPPVVMLAVKEGCFCSITRDTSQADGTTPIAVEFSPKNFTTI